MTTSIDTRTTTVTEGPFAPYTNIVAYQRRISPDLVIIRTTEVSWSGYHYGLHYLPVESDRLNGQLGRYAGSLGYHDSNWLTTDEAVVTAESATAELWASHVAPFEDGREPRVA